MYESNGTDRSEAEVTDWSREWVAKEVGRLLGHVPHGGELRLWQEVFVTKLLELWAPWAMDTYRGPGQSRTAELDVLPARFVRSISAKGLVKFRERHTPNARHDFLLAILRRRVLQEGKEPSF